ncbi:MAG: hypothetical protein ABJZ55_09500 [Fuerstiella sp.]
MQGQKAMSYKQLFLLILTIWSAELFTAFLFDSMITSETEFRTVYLAKSPVKDSDEDLFLGSSMADLGQKGWQMKAVVPNPDNAAEVVVFFERKRVRRFLQ